MWATQPRDPTLIALPWRKVSPANMKGKRRPGLTWVSERMHWCAEGYCIRWPDRWGRPDSLCTCKLPSEERSQLSSVDITTTYERLGSSDVPPPFRNCCNIHRSLDVINASLRPLAQEPCTPVVQGRGSGLLWPRRVLPESLMWVRRSGPRPR